MSTTTPGRRTTTRPGRGGGGWAPALTPRIAVRIAILGGIALALLSVLLVRLWFLQVISGEQYAERAEGNRLRTVVTEAPRGNVLTRDGVPLVTNRQGENLVARPRELTGPRRERVLRRLAVRLRAAGVDTSLPAMRRAMTAGDDRPLEPVVLAENIPDDLYRYMAERRRDFPGVSLQRSWLRDYPQGALGAHIVGSTGRIGPEEIDDYRRRGYSGNETVGKGGIEAQYERYLAGTPGEALIEVDASGEPRGREFISSQAPTPGRDIQLSIDSDTQRALEDALGQAARVTGATGASGVALDPDTGEVLALASYPTFEPEMFVERDQRKLTRFLNDSSSPGLDRAIGGVYPAGSTFKPITASAALRANLIEPTTQLESMSSITLYEQEFDNFRNLYHGWVDLPSAMRVSSDTYFYQVADMLYRAESERNKRFPLQEEARRFGLGKPTGIDLAGEQAGTVPDPPWKQRQYAGPDYTDFQRSWLAGDTIQLGIGQGFLQVTPLQMAVAYAAIANGGTVVTPSVGRRVLEPSGRVVRELSKGRPTRTVEIAAQDLAAIRQGLFDAANGVDGTATAVFGNLPDGKKVAGKTGTAEPGDGGEDHSWFVGYGPFEDPQIVVAVVVERGGTGANAAAPAVCTTMGAFLDYDAGLCGEGAEAN
ncbi:penicillin-binding protein 2 [Miltoncostaea marina]|uniref:penicillin-binding protein 2 n=1 Tax=Miltoncostaea marina TaxID=2843215 RepID=UPI001C3DB0C2|nr:penicillin-binding protein 2 [Miltoncostaea marina]